jgi:hypothetical protein
MENMYSEFFRVIVEGIKYIGYAVLGILIVLFQLGFFLLSTVATYLVVKWVLSLFGIYLNF